MKKPVNKEFCAIFKLLQGACHHADANAMQLCGKALDRVEEELLCDGLRMSGSTMVVNKCSSSIHHREGRHCRGELGGQLSKQKRTPNY